MRRFRVLAAALVLSAYVVVALPVVSYAAPLRSALRLDTDPCGSEPSLIFHPLEWASWEACEWSNGHGAAPITNVVDPLMGQVVYYLTQIDADLQAMAGGVGGIAGGVGDAVGGAISGLGSAIGALGTTITSRIGVLWTDIVTFVSPSNDAYIPISTALDNATSGYEPFHTITLLLSTVRGIQESWGNGSGGSVFPGGGSLSGGPGVPGTGDYGAIGGGLALFVSVMSSMGLSQGTVKALIDWGVAIGMLMSMMSDIGVVFGGTTSIIQKMKGQE